MSAAGPVLILAALWGLAPGLPQGAPVDPVPWEPGDVPPALCAPHPSRHGYLGRVELALIRMYQRDIGSRSISRCPFRISCSEYGKLAIEKKGSLLGLLYTLDRYFLRENVSAYGLYPRVHDSEGLVKLEDGWFLLGDP